MSVYMLVYRLVSFVFVLVWYPSMSKYGTWNSYVTWHVNDSLIMSLYCIQTCGVHAQRCYPSISFDWWLPLCLLFGDPYTSSSSSSSFFLNCHKFDLCLWHLCADYITTTTIYNTLLHYHTRTHTHSVKHLYVQGNNSHIHTSTPRHKRDLCCKWL